MKMGQIIKDKLFLLGESSQEQTLAIAVTQIKWVGVWIEVKKMVELSDQDMLKKEISRYWVEVCQNIGMNRERKIIKVNI